MSVSNDNLDDRLVLFERDLERLGITQGTDALRALEKKGLFPPRRRLGVRQICWLRSQVMEHLNNLPLATDRPLPGRAKAAATVSAKGIKLGRPTNAERAARAAAKAKAKS